jgi:hypothetical protein
MGEKCRPGKWDNPVSSGAGNTAGTGKGMEPLNLAGFLSKPYGSVRPVVWEDGGGNPASYPI